MDPKIIHDIHTVTGLLRDRYQVKSYIVGGAVRDYLLGHKSIDFDIECYGITPEDFERAMRELGAEGVGRSFFVYKYHNLDIALPRTEKKTGRGHRSFSVLLATEEREASKRRDFTINALMYDIEREEILDFWDGLRDIREKLLRIVNQVSFAEDSLRVLRAMQFSARFGFRVEEESCRLCRGIGLDDLPKERIFLEFEKMFRGAYLHYGLYYLFSLDIAAKLFPGGSGEGNFMIIGRQLQRYRKNFLDSLRPYYFLYISAPCFGLKMEEILARIGAPGIYRKKIADAPQLPPSIDCAFVATAAEREGIRSFVGNYHSRVRELAKKMGIWDQPFGPGVTPAYLISMGFSGKDLGEELARRREERIGRLNEDCTEF